MSIALLAGLLGKVGAATSTINTVTGAVNSMPAPGQVMDGIKKSLSVVTNTINSIFPNANISLQSNGFSNSEETLGEKYMYFVEGVDIHDHNKVPSDKIVEAKRVFPLIFCIPIHDMYDVDKLDQGVDAYYTSPRAVGVPRAAVERAVFLKQTYFRYEFRKWNVDDITKVPVVVSGLGGSVQDYYNMLAGGASGNAATTSSGSGSGVFAGIGNTSGAGSTGTNTQNIWVWIAGGLAALVVIYMAGKSGIFGQRKRY